jgi:hypothetical protein
MKLWQAKGIQLLKGTVGDNFLQNTGRHLAHEKANDASRIKMILRSREHVRTVPSLQSRQGRVENSELYHQQLDKQNSE